MEALAARGADMNAKNKVSGRGYQREGGEVTSTMTDGVVGGYPHTPVIPPHTLLYG